MKFNEKTIFLQTRRSKIKTKIKTNKCKAYSKIIIFISIIIFLLFLLMFVIIYEISNRNEEEKENIVVKNDEKIKVKKEEIINETNNIILETSSIIANETKNHKPKIVQITYGNSYFTRQLKLNNKSAIEVGEVDEHYAYHMKDLDDEFKKKNKGILSRGRGNGLWLWKPYIINKTIVEKLNDGDYLIYTDAAMLFMNSTRLLIDFLNEQNASMWFNRLTLKERKFSKRDAFILMDADTPYYYDTNQYMAGIQIYKKSNYTVKFIQEWLTYCQDERIITGQKNVMGKENYKGFVDNRHDQTALSLLIKKYGEANAGSPNMTMEELKQRKHIIMPNIICMYRRKPFKDYDDIKEKCKKTIKYQDHIFS
jgi:hypothetical protein